MNNYLHKALMKKLAENGGKLERREARELEVLIQDRRAD
jgi:hypothetical protein